MKKSQEIFELLDRAISLFYKFIRLEPAYVNYTNLSLRDSNYWYNILLKSRISLCIMMFIGAVSGILTTSEIINLINNRSTIGIILLAVSQIYLTVLFSSIIFFIISQVFYYSSRKNKRNIEISWSHLALMFLLPLAGTMVLFMPLWIA